MTIEATHVPAPGLYAHLASTGLTDRVVLDYHNGRPSLLVLEIDETPVLAWMMLGHGSTAEVWLYLPLAGDEAETLVDEPPVALAEWLSHRVGRVAFVGLAEDGVLIFTAGWRVPDLPAKQLPARAVEAAVEEMLQASRSAEALPLEARQALGNSQPRFRELADAS
jgi:hypothetical protein